MALVRHRVSVALLCAVAMVASGCGRGTSTTFSTSPDTAATDSTTGVSFQGQISADPDPQHDNSEHEH